MVKKILISLIIIFLLAGCGSGSEFTYEFDPEFGEVQDIDSFFTEFFNKRLQSNPELASWMGEYEGYQANRQDDKLYDISFDFRQREIDFYKNALDVLLTFDESGLSQEQKVNRDALVWFLNNQIQGEAFIRHNYLTNHFNGVATSLPSSLERNHQVNSIEDAESYIERLKAFPWKLEQLTKGIEEQMELGIIPPDSSLSAYISAVSRVIQPEPSQNSLYTSFVAKLEDIDLTPDQRSKLARQALDAIEEHVYPAYKEHHQAILPYTRDLNKPSVSAGVWELPQGDEYYAYLVKQYTTTNYSPEEIHQLGLREVERILGEIRHTLDEMGYQGQETYSVLRHLASENIIRDRDKILAEYRNVVEKMYEVLPDLFNTLPQGPVFVEPIPPHRENSYTNHYAIPSRDGKRPGTFFVNLGYPHARKDIEALAAHEAVPGHHLQLAIQVEAGLPLFRDTFSVTAFTEGWALYAEKLMYEHGYYSDPLSELGYLQSELFRAARLVVDTGIHYKQWTRREAVDYLNGTTGMRFDNEVERYIIWPGQALAYKVGELKILELRDLAINELEDKFDLKEFHDVVLLSGSVPLEVLEDIVLRYIEAKLN